MASILSGEGSMFYLVEADGGRRLHPGLGTYHRHQDALDDCTEFPLCTCITSMLPREGWYFNWLKQMMAEGCLLDRKCLINTRMLSMIRTKFA